MNDFGYYAKTVAEDINISPNTLRRWSIELEKQGYRIERSEKNNRIYYERDYKAFRELKKLLDAGVSMESATSTIANSFKSSDNVTITPSVHERESTEIERFSNRFEEKLNIMLQEVVSEIAITTVQPVLNELSDLRSELSTQRKENTELKELFKTTLSQIEQAHQQQLDEYKQENEKLKNLLENVYTEQTKEHSEEKQTTQQLEEIRMSLQAFDKQLKDSIEKQKQDSNRSFFQRLFKK